MIRRRIQSALGLGLGVGAATFFGAEPFLKSMASTEEEQREQIIACANVLGETATESSEVPENCDRYHFNETQEIIITYTDSGVERVRTVTFDLPIRDDFIESTEEHIRTDEETAETARRLRNYSTPAFAGFAAVLGFALPLASIPEPKERLDFTSSPGTSEAV